MLDVGRPEWCLAYRLPASAASNCSERIVSVSTTVSSADAGSIGTAVGDVGGGSVGASVGRTGTLVGVGSGVGRLVDAGADTGGGGP